MQTVEEIDNEIEVTVGSLYASFYKLRQIKAYKKEYETLDTLIRMFIEDKLAMLRSYKKEIEE